MSDHPKKPSELDAKSESASGFAEAPRISDALENLSATKAMASIQKDLEEIQRLSVATLPRIDMGATAHLAKALEAHQRQWREIAQPLEKISAGLRIENDFARIIESQRAKFADIKLPFESLSESLRQSMDSIQSSLSGAAAASKLLLQSFDEGQRLRLEELAKPFQISKAFTESALSETLKLSLGQLEISERFRLPALDPIATSAIAKLWEAGDLQERIRFISEDLERVLQEAAEEAETPVAGEPAAGRKQPLIHLDFWTIFNLLLTLAILAYQEAGSARMEARLSQRIDSANANAAAATQKQIANLQALLVQALSARQPWEMGQTQFVVRSRVARIRKSPKAGSPIVAEVFPNQVVALLGERGKWLHVEYFDWIAGEKRDGWALKKYFVRVRPVEPISANSEYNKD